MGLLRVHLTLNVESGTMNIEQATDLGHVELLLDGARGIYLPQAFAQHFDGWPIGKEDSDVLLAGPDHPEYWDAWSDVLVGEYDLDGDTWTLWQDGDLWAVRSRHNGVDVYIDWE